MKRILLTSGMILCVSIPSYATGSGFTQSESTATSNALTVSNACVEPRLGVYEGPTTLNAVWNPNTINITWDDNGATTAHTGGDTSCVYDNSVTLPTPPQRIGFIFRGWGVGSASSGFDLSTLDASIDTTWDAQHARWKPVYSTGFSMQDVLGTENSSDLAPGEWADTFSYGTVKGKSLCSSTSGTFAQSGTPDESGTGDTRYCWCKATQFDNSPVSSASWVFRNDGGEMSDCAFNCAVNCASRVQRDSAFRGALFGVSGS